jgi:glyoxylase-like metal-dependent hydrolase (beta-lactamase superfamily II)
LQPEGLCADNQNVEGVIDSPGPEGVFRLQWRGRNVYLLWRGRDVTLVGAGGPGHMTLIEQALAMRRLETRNIKAILLTHADILLCANLRQLRALGKPLVYINRLEASRLDPKPKTGWNLAALREKKLLREMNYKAGSVDLYVADGDVLDQWYGMTVIGLHGPTAGNCGYYCRHLDTLFTGALHRERTLRERILGPAPHDREQLAQGLAKVATMKPKWALES